MKFAKYLHAESVPEWRKKYIDYKGLKKVLKRAQQALEREREREEREAREAEEQRRALNMGLQSERSEQTSPIHTSPPLMSRQSIDSTNRIHELPNGSRHSISATPSQTTTTVTIPTYGAISDAEATSSIVASAPAIQSRPSDGKYRISPELAVDHV
jgi:hypothetical protein